MPNLNCRENRTDEPDLVEILATPGLDVKQDGSYPLHQAVERSHQKIVQILLAHGAGSNRKTIEKAAEILGMKVTMLGINHLTEVEESMNELVASFGVGDEISWRCFRRCHTPPKMSPKIKVVSFCRWRWSELFLLYFHIRLRKQISTKLNLVNFLTQGTAVEYKWCKEDTIPR